MTAVVGGGAVGGGTAAGGAARPGPKIRLSGIRKAFPVRRGTFLALDGVSLEVGEGEFLCLLGPSGCGKTTLMRILAGLETPSAGALDIRPSAAGRPLCGVVFQEQSVLPWMTVRQNIGYGLRLRRVPPPEREAVVDRFLGMVGLAAFADDYPHRLSGGMKQRVSIARAFANDPDVLLMDEPFASLDEQNRVLLQQELLEIWEGSGKTVVFVTHSIDEALALGDRIVVMTAAPGRVKADLPVAIPRPRRIPEVRDHPVFRERFQTVWALLREEVATTPTAVRTPGSPGTPGRTSAPGSAPRARSPRTG